MEGTRPFIPALTVAKHEVDEMFGILEGALDGVRQYGEVNMVTKTEVTKTEAIERLTKIIHEIDGIKAKGRNSTAFTKWHRDALTAIRHIFGVDSSHVQEFDNIHFSPFVMVYPSPTAESEFDEAFIEGMEKACVILQSMVDEIEEYWKDEKQQIVKQTFASTDFWGLLHPKVVSLARSRFESKHYADSVEAACKEINSVVKDIVKRNTNQEHDGADLMFKAFNLPSPIITLDDLSTETGKNIQEGYKHIFAGTMKGIRNPKAHQNIDLEEKRAIHLLFLASLLMYKIDERSR